MSSNYTEPAYSLKFIVSVVFAVVHCFVDAHAGINHRKHRIAPRKKYHICHTKTDKKLKKKSNLLALKHAKRNEISNFFALKHASSKNQIYTHCDN